MISDRYRTDKVKRKFCGTDSLQIRYVTGHIALSEKNSKLYA